MTDAFYYGILKKRQVKMLSRKNHMIIEGKLVRTDKNFSHLKRSQVTKISEWMWLAYKTFRDEHNRPPRNIEIDRIAVAIYEKIQEVEIWISYDEVLKHFRGKLVRLGNKYEKQNGEANNGEC